MIEVVMLLFQLVVFVVQKREGRCLNEMGEGGYIKDTPLDENIVLLDLTHTLEFSRRCHFEQAINHRIFKF